MGLVGSELHTACQGQLMHSLCSCWGLLSIVRVTTEMMRWEKVRAPASHLPVPVSQQEVGTGWS